MGTGFLEVVTTAAQGGMPVVDEKVTVSSEGEILYELRTDKNGVTETVALEAPPKELTLDENFEGIPYSVCDVKVEAESFLTVIIHDVEILDTETSILPVFMTPSINQGGNNENESIEFFIPPHDLVSDEPLDIEAPPENRIPASPRVLSEVIIPEFITVHLGRPNNPARNVRVPFTYYIKNCASHEIYSTWPPASLEANIYCIISVTFSKNIIDFPPSHHPLHQP